MLDDFTMIQHQFPDNSYINIYPLGDVHLGSKECNICLLRDWISMVEKDQNGYVVIVGDLMNMGLRNSKSNIYEEVLTPMQQKEFISDLLSPISNKILAGCSGNHEYRAVKEVGINPLYDVFCKLGIEDRYRENICFMKLSVGSYRHNPNVYGVVLTHGKSKNKDADWTYVVDGADVFINGHTHLGTHQPTSKIKMDLSHNSIKAVNYQHIVVLPFQQYGGYAIRNKYKPTAIGKFQRITFDGTTKKVGYQYN